MRGVKSVIYMRGCMCIKFIFGVILAIINFKFHSYPKKKEKKEIKSAIRLLFSKIVVISV